MYNGSMRVRGWLFAASCVGWLGCTHDFGAFQTADDHASDAASADGGSGGDAGSDDGGASDVATSDGGTTGDGGVPCTETDGVTFGGHCYFPLSTRQSWSAADSACKAASAHLVTLGSADEQNAVQPILVADDRWIGLDRPAGSPTGDASFAWTTGEARSYTNWGAGEPNGSGECARMKGSSGQWADVSCTSSLRSICERE